MELSRSSGNRSQGRQVNRPAGEGTHEDRRVTRASRQRRQTWQIDLAVGIVGVDERVEVCADKTGCSRQVEDCTGIGVDTAPSEIR